ncbi:peptide ABC transporter permease [Alicyclobacillus cellulosilyticus]|uniref:Peptide ABC transporter permease n=1 Tax=Alicyclobacillus cellulosilyticus TaxID=1003997 RepID=A0A917K1L0_9BACL|nr:ABC transporter permease [Alicyclobacillus cellulosilyticus]GGI97512.1 peptide ABC transporter permease [Alicyclobacillus cellulosilyticus]
MSTVLPNGSLTQAAERKRGIGRALVKSIREYPMVYLGSFIVFVLIVVAVFAPWLAPYDPTKQFANGLTPDGMPVAPNHQFLLGTDDVGRDELSRLIYGSRVSLEVGIFATFISLVIGTTLGLISGYFGGVIDSVIMRLTDVVLAFPFLLLTMALVAVLQPSVTNVFIAIGVQGWGTMARVVRGQVLAVKSFEYVQAERAIGASTARILFRVILPNVLGPVIVLAALSVGFNILAEAGLSVLGIGVQPPTPSWGNMVSEGLLTYRFAPWMMWAPGTALLIAVLGFNLLGDGLRDIFDPRTTTHG